MTVVPRPEETNPTEVGSQGSQGAGDEFMEIEGLVVVLGPVEDVDNRCSWLVAERVGHVYRGWMHLLATTVNWG